MNELTEAIAEVHREIRVRNVIYPGLVTRGKLTRDEADRRLRSLRHAAYYLEAALTDMNTARPTTVE